MSNKQLFLSKKYFFATIQINISLILINLFFSVVNKKEVDKYIHQTCLSTILATLDLILEHVFSVSLKLNN